MLLRISWKPELQVQLFDPLGSPEVPAEYAEGVEKRFAYSVRNVVEWITSHPGVKTGGTRLSCLSYSEFRREPASLQPNGYDCGVFVCGFAQALSTGQTTTFSNRFEFGPSFRLHIAAALCREKLL